jgi:hypothetical protein
LFCSEPESLSNLTKTEENGITDIEGEGAAMLSKKGRSTWPLSLMKNLAYHLTSWWISNTSKGLPLPQTTMGSGGSARAAMCRRNASNSLAHWRSRTPVAQDGAEQKETTHHFHIR